MYSYATGDISYINVKNGNSLSFDYYEIYSLLVVKGYKNVTLNTKVGVRLIAFYDKYNNIVVRFSRRKWQKEN